MARWLRCLFASTALGWLSTPAICDSAEPRGDVASSERVRMDRTTIEARLRERRRLTFNRDGTIRNAAGRVVGYWGIDAPAKVQMR